MENSDRFFNLKIPYMTTLPVIVTQRKIHASIKEDALFIKFHKFSAVLYAEIHCKENCDFTEKQIWKPARQYNFKEIICIHYKITDKIS